MFFQIYKKGNTQLILLMLLSVSAFTCILFPVFSKQSYQAFLLISLPLFYFDFKVFRQDKFFLLLLFSICIQTFSWVNSIFVYPEFSNDFPKLDRLLKLFSFIFIAYWLRGSKERVFFVFVSFILGFIVSLIFSPELIDDITLALGGKRVDFGVKNAQYTSMFSGLFIILLVFYLFKTEHDPYLFHKARKTIIGVLCVSLLIVVFVLIVSQSRQIWFALILIFILFPLMVMFFFPRVSRIKIFLLYVFLLFLMVVVSKVSIVEKRISYTFVYEYGLFYNTLNQDKVQSIGNGVRINSWLDAFGWIKTNPILGAGPNAIGEVIKNSKRLSKKAKKHLGHLHSFHLEILVAYGILGALVIYGMYYWLIRSLVLAHREDPELKIYTVLGICFLIFWIIINFFESFSSRSYGVYVHNIMFGCLYTFYFTQQRKKIEEAEACA